MFLVNELNKNMNQATSLVQTFSSCGWSQVAHLDRTYAALVDGALGKDLSKSYQLVLNRCQRLFARDTAFFAQIQIYQYAGRECVQLSPNDLELADMQ